MRNQLDPDDRIPGRYLVRRHRDIRLYRIPPHDVYRLPAKRKVRKVNGKLGDLLFCKYFFQFFPSFFFVKFF